MTKDADYVLPSDPESRRKIRHAIAEMAGVIQFCTDKKDYSKDVAKSLKEEYSIPIKVANRMARTLHKRDYEDVSQESEVFNTCYEGLFMTQEASGDDLSDELSGTEEDQS